MIFDTWFDTSVSQEAVVSFKRDLYLVLPDKVNLRQKNVFAGALTAEYSYEEQITKFPVEECFGVAEATVSQDRQQFLYFSGADVDRR